MTTSGRFLVVIGVFTSLTIAQVGTPASLPAWPVSKAMGAKWQEPPPPTPSGGPRKRCKKKCGVLIGVGVGIIGLGAYTMAQPRDPSKLSLNFQQYDPKASGAVVMGIGAGFVIGGLLSKQY